MTAETEDAALAVERAMVIAEAKLLVRRLDIYLEWIGEWAAEEGEEDASD